MRPVAFLPVPALPQGRSFLAWQDVVSTCKQLEKRSGFSVPRPPPSSPSASHNEASQSDRTTHTVTFRGQKIAVPKGSQSSLRSVLLRADAAALTPHNGKANVINCRGLGTCGTCAVAVVSGVVSPPDVTARERIRLSLPPHDLQRARIEKLRLACQVRVCGDVELVKFDRFWGQGDGEQPYPG